MKEIWSSKSMTVEDAGGLSAAADAINQGLHDAAGTISVGQHGAHAVEAIDADGIRWAPAAQACVDGQKVDYATISRGIMKFGWPAYDGGSGVKFPLSVRAVVYLMPPACAVSSE